MYSEWSPSEMKRTRPAICCYGMSPPVSMGPTFAVIAGDQGPSLSRAPKTLWGSGEHSAATLRAGR